MKFLFIITMLAFGVAGCTNFSSQGIGGQSDNQQPASLDLTKVTFIDLPKFDNDLANSLVSSQNSVEVLFYANVTPNELPLRLQRWLTSVEKNGGHLRIKPPEGELAPKNPLILAGLVGSLWSSLKALSEIRDRQILDASIGHDVILHLSRNAQGGVLIEKIIFTRWPKTN